MIDSHFQFSKYDYLKAAADIIDETDPDNIYMGYAKKGHQDEGAIGWSIAKIAKAADITRIKWAGGQFDFAHEWDERAAATYTYKGF